jgi:hypothetical protein
MDYHRLRQLFGKNQLMRKNFYLALSGRMIAKKIQPYFSISHYFRVMSQSLYFQEGLFIHFFGIVRMEAHASEDPFKAIG